MVSKTLMNIQKVMKRFIVPIFSLITLCSCGNHKANREETLNKVSQYEYQIEPTYGSNILYLNDDNGFASEYEDYDEDEDEGWEYSSAFRDGSGNITAYDLNGNYYYGYRDAYGNVSGYDSKGNYYHSYTDNYGNTTGYDSKGNYYHSHTDSYGNTIGYDVNGNYYHYHTDSYGYTTGYDGDGNYVTGYTDDYGNTTITTY